MHIPIRNEDETKNFYFQRYERNTVHQQPHKISDMNEKYDTQTALEIIALKKREDRRLLSWQFLTFPVE